MKTGRQSRRLAAACLLAAIATASSGVPASAGITTRHTTANSAGSVTGPQSTPTSGSQASGAPVPVLAFYYSWFDTRSWRRAKADYPQIGRYTSDDPAVMRQHVRWAKEAGIDGFIVSWKDTPTNDRRLSLLMQVARSEHFKLAMIYQGLDFQRHPLPIERVAADFRYFEMTYAADPAFFRLDGKALTVWSGTWAYSHADVARVVAPVRDSMLVLNTEKNLDGYKRLADITDGDAYYWSSVNPATNPNYAAKLDEMSRTIHADGNYWVAPFAPGFDARKVGGSQSVEREDGATLRTEYATALSSSPDVLGLISWNEFSENSYVEPSQKYGRRYLDVLADLRQAVTPTPAAAVDSSDPAPAHGPGLPFGLKSTQRTWLLLGFALAFVAGTAALRPLVRRRDEELGLLVDPATRPALPSAGPALPSTEPAAPSTEPPLPPDAGFLLDPLEDDEATPELPIASPVDHPYPLRGRHTIIVPRARDDPAD
jgi:hypothetical protein